MKKIFWVILLLGLVTTIFAQNPQGGVELVVVRYIHDGNMTYPYTLKGVQSHLETLSFIPEKREQYEALRPIVKDMKKKKRNTNILSVAIGSVGIGTAVAGGVMRGTSDEFSSEHDTGSSLMFGGGVLALGAVLPQIFGGVKDDDLLRYINNYNALNPDFPLKVY